MLTICQALDEPLFILNKSKRFYLHKATKQQKIYIQANVARQNQCDICLVLSAKKI